MTNLTFPVKSFKNFKEPFEDFPERKKYRFYVMVKDVPEQLLDWMQTNPRDQKLSTDVAKAISNSLEEDNKSFHLWNRGILLSAEDVEFDNKSNLATIKFNNPKLHGNIDGGHTLRIIINAQKISKLTPNKYPEQYVEFEVITGIENPELLAEARNTSTPVDTKSIEELRNTFDCLKSIMKDKKIQGETYYNRIAFRQNEHLDNEAIRKNIIDVREIIAIINMFNPVLYKLDSSHPVQSYTGKEASLNKFLKMGSNKSIDDEECRQYRDEVTLMMSNIIPIIFEIWDYIECNFIEASTQIKKRYGAKKYANYEKGKYSAVSLFSNKKLIYTIPKGIIYPLIGAFRALVRFNEKENKYYFVESPYIVWDALKLKLVEAILNASQELGNNPNAIGKSVSLWDNLFKEIYIHSLKLNQ